MKKRKWIIVLVALIIVAVLSGGIWNISVRKAYRVPSNKVGTYVYDNAKIITREDEDTLNSLMRELTEKTEVVCCVVSMRSHKDMDVDAYAEMAFSGMGFDKLEIMGRDGVLICISANDKEIAVKTTSSLSGVLDDTVISAISHRHYIPYNTTEHSTGVEKTCTSIALVVASHFDADVCNLRFTNPYSENAIRDIVIIVASAFVCLVTVVFIADRSSKAKHTKRRRIVMK